MTVSAIIPTYNREKYLPRAIESIFNQNTDEILEIIIVDDGSTDNTEKLVESYFENSKVSIKYFKNIKSVGGAVSRNIGASKAKGKYIAFLDSDDEWLPNHIVNSLLKLSHEETGGTYSNFILSDGKKIKDRNISFRPPTMTMGDYILSNTGDTRTSTFVFEKSKFDKIKFDDDLKKHQDWDLAIRFDEAYGMSIVEEASAILHNDIGNRMSNSNNHQASELFINKHKNKLEKNTLSNFYLNLAINTLRFEGKNKSFKNYLSEALHYSNKKDLKQMFKILLIKFPFINMVRVYDYLK